MQHWRPATAVLAAIAAAAIAVSSPAGAAPIFYSEDAPLVAEEIPTELTGLGSDIRVSGDVIIVGGEMGTSQVSSTLLSAETLAPIATVTSNRSIGYGTGHIVTIDGPRSNESLRVYGVTVDGVSEIATTPISSTTNFDRLGTQLGANQEFVAVVDGGQGQVPDVVRVFEISSDPEAPLNEVQTIEPGLSNTHIEVVGSTLVVSGVPPIGNVGHLVLYALGDGSEIGRINNIGGGPVVVDQDAIFVQRNQFFAEPGGTWTMVEFANSEVGNVFEIPVIGSSLAVNEQLVLVGDPIRNQTLVLERTPAGEDGWPFRFTQSIRSPGQGSLDKFGAAVALLGDQALIGSPTTSVGDLVLRGSVLAYGLADGPIGCTIVGTPGDDEKLTGTTGRDTLCGLAGEDRILGFSGDDVLYGGPGNDALLGNGGDDILYGEDGDDILNGSDGNDTLFGNDGDDTGNGGAGDDTFIGGLGLDKGNGGEGTNTCDAEQRFLC